MPPIIKGDKMSSSKKHKLFIILTAVGFGLLLLIMILGAIFPGNPPPDQAPWFVWASIGETLAFIVATVIIGIVVRKKDQENCE